MAIKNDGKIDEANENDSQNENGETGTETGTDTGNDTKQGSQGDSGASDNGSNEGGNGSSESKEKTFTQDDVNRMMTKEKKQGRNAAFKELGIDPNDEKTVALVKALVESQKDDGGFEDDSSSVELEEAQRERDIANAKVEAMMLGIKPQYVDDAVTLAVTKMANEEGSELKTVLGEFKTKYPDWFGGSDEDDKGSVGKKGTGSSIDSSSTKGKQAETGGIGKRLAAQRKPGKSGFSYFGNK